tara:strand:- start:3243 stop:3848 length:606 start_codon:yes stop_codon:yes gene_type:complete
MSAVDAGALDRATKKREIFAPLTGFKAAGYEPPLAKSNGDSAAGGGVPKETPKEINMAGPWQPGEWSNWGKASHDLTADGRVVVCDHVKGVFLDLMEIERLTCAIAEKVELLSDCVDDDSQNAKERTLFMCLGMEQFPPRAPEFCLRLHGSAAVEVRQARDALRALAFHAQAADAAYKRAREAMNSDECEHWCFLRAQEKP